MKASYIANFKEKILLPGPGFEPGSVYLRAGALPTEPLR